MGALPASNGMAFILVQHLDPTHESMMVDLLAGHTSMTVRQATDGMPIERDHLYVIPPGTYLSVGNGALHLSQPQARHGARLPFDFLLHSLAEECGARAICVILSGTGADGSLGLKAVKEKGGLVIAQDPDEAGYDGMPRSAIMTGAVDLVLPVAEIPEALVKYNRRMNSARARNACCRRTWSTRGSPRSSIFCARRPPTISRSTSRARCSAGSNGAWRWRRSRPMTWIGISSLLRSDTSELDLLAKDLLINVTSFFRDPKVFDLLARKIIPDLVHRAAARSADPHLDRRMQHGRGNLFPRHALSRTDRSSEAQRQAAGLRLRCRSGRCRQRARGSLSGDDRGGRVAGAPCPLLHEGRTQLPVSPELRATVVFTVQDVLADPPFSRLDLVSCRNLLIYLRPEAQAKVRLAVPFCAARGRHSSARQLGDGGQRRRPLRADLQIGAALSAHRSQPAGRSWLCNERRRRVRESVCARAKARYPRVRPLSPIFAGAW